MGSRKQKPFAYFSDLDEFKKYKISCSADNTHYFAWNSETGEWDQQILLDGETMDVYFDTICYIEAEHLQFTRGAFYGEDTSPVWQQI